MSISNCSVTMQVQDGEFVRVSPKKPGTYKCWDDGIVTGSSTSTGT